MRLVDTIPTLSIGLRVTGYQALYIDADGPENGGHFEDKTVFTHQMDRTQVKDGESWYTGMFELSAEIKLSAKPAEQPDDESGNESNGEADNNSQNE